MDGGLTLRYIPLSHAVTLAWGDNPKLHDTQAIVESIERHGFKDPPKFEPALNGGGGGIVEGNGRIQALAYMKRQKNDPPEGIGVDEEDWYIPVLFGVDASSSSAAEAYGVDHNNLVLSGGDFTAKDVARLWNPGYLDVLTRLQDTDELPTSVSTEAMNAIMQSAGRLPVFLFDGAPDVEVNPIENDDETNPSHVRMFQLFLNTQTHPAFTRMVNLLKEHWNLSNPTETVMEAVRYACHQLDIPTE